MKKETKVKNTLVGGEKLRAIRMARKEERIGKRSVNTETTLSGGKRIREIRMARRNARMNANL